MPELIEATTYHQTRRHYAHALDQPRPGGRSGQALCSAPSLQTVVYDQAYHEHIAKSWSAHVVKRLSDLPLCKKCEKKAQRMTEAAASDA